LVSRTASADSFSGKVSIQKYTPEQCTAYERDDKLFEYLNNETAYAALRISIDGLDQFSFDDPDVIDRFITLVAGAEAQTISVIAQVTLPNVLSFSIPLFSLSKTTGSRQVIRPDRVTPYFRVGPVDQIILQYKVQYSKTVKSNFIDTARNLAYAITSASSSTALPLLNLLDATTRQRLDKLKTQINSGLSLTRAIDDAITLDVLDIVRTPSCRASKRGLRLTLEDIGAFPLIVDTYLHFVPTILAARIPLSKSGRPDFSSILTARIYVRSQVAVDGYLYNDYFAYFSDKYYYQEFMQGNFVSKRDPLNSCARILQVLAEKFGLNRYDKYAVFLGFLNANEVLKNNHDLRLKALGTDSCLESDEWAEMKAYYKTPTFVQNEMNWRQEQKKIADQERKLVAERSTKPGSSSERRLRSKRNFEEGLSLIATCRKKNENRCDHFDDNYRNGISKLINALSDTSETSDEGGVAPVLRAGFGDSLGSTHRLLFYTKWEKFFTLVGAKNVLDGIDKNGTKLAALVKSNAMNILAELAQTHRFSCIREDGAEGVASTGWTIWYDYNTKDKISVLEFVRVKADTLSGSTDTQDDDGESLEVSNICYFSDDELNRKV